MPMPITAPFPSPSRSLGSYRGSLVSDSHSLVCICLPLVSY